MGGQISENSSSASLLASSHVDGSVKVYKFSSFEELRAKHRDCRPDIHFKDHFFSANQVTFAKNLYNVNCEELPAESTGGHQPWMLTCSDDTMIHMYDIEQCQLVRSFIGN